MNEDQRFLEKCATLLRERRLEAPAIFMLEMHKPLSTVVRESVRFFSPMLMPFLGAQNTARLISVLENPENIEQLLRLLESGEAVKP